MRSTGSSSISTVPSYAASVTPLWAGSIPRPRRTGPGTPGWSSSGGQVRQGPRVVHPQDPRDPVTQQHGGDGSGTHDEALEQVEVNPGEMGQGEPDDVGV